MGGAVETANSGGGERWGHIDAAVIMVVPPTLASAGRFAEGLAVVQHRGDRRRGVRRVIDTVGRVVFETPHDLRKPFSAGLNAARVGEAFGDLDVAGRWAIPPQFEQCEPFADGLGVVQPGDWSRPIDRAGQFVWGPTTEGVG